MGDSKYVLKKGLMSHLFVQPLISSSIHCAAAQNTERSSSIPLPFVNQQWSWMRKVCVQACQNAGPYEQLVALQRKSKQMPTALP